MLCVVIKGPSYAEAYQQLEKAILLADLVELRIDLLDAIDLEKIQDLQEKFKIPFLFTLRTKEQGGNFSALLEERKSLISKLAALSPSYFDIEFDLPKEFFLSLQKKHLSIQWIVSYHDFEKTVEYLEAIYALLLDFSASFYKIALKAESTIDAIRLLLFARAKKNKLIAVSMGEFGQITRILAPYFALPFTYASLEEETFLGQIPAKILKERYRFSSITPATKIYGLIGDPVGQSISDETHNYFFQRQSLDCVYVKMAVRQEELGVFLQLAKEIPIHGLSVTMPLKEWICSCLDFIEEKAESIGAVNTLVLRQDRWSGYNTDSLGALEAIEAKFPIEGKKVVLLGTGGSAKAIARGVIDRGGLLTVVGRSLEKAEAFAWQFHAQGKGISQMEEIRDASYDLLINCTPSMPISKKDLLSSGTIMDIQTKPLKTPLIESALEKNCRVIYGYEMFVRQAIAQFFYWFTKEEIGLSKEEASALLLQKAEAFLKT